MPIQLKIPFNKPFLTGKEAHYLYQAIYSGKISGNGLYTKKCQSFFEDKYSFKKCLLTTSCTDALEMAAILMNIEPGDEVIIPSYTFVSTANAFVLRGAKIVFADSYANNPNLDPHLLEKLITPKTKAIIVVHYAGVACDMDLIAKIAQKHDLFLIEDAAQAIDSFYKNKPLGGIGHLAAFSFHETKNIISGEGGMLVINDETLIERSEIIWEKGTNRAAFFRGEIDKYSWVDIGSSFLPSEVVAAFLYAQLENLDLIQQKRKKIWQYYYDQLQRLATKSFFKLPHIPEYASKNGHLFYLICRSVEERTALIKHLRADNIHAVFHYLSLHKSPFYQDKHTTGPLPNCDYFSDCLVRLPLYYELDKTAQDHIINSIYDFYNL
jgi:dTDP-4-amino-4,6-dideoxygalactose transaminase